MKYKINISKKTQFIVSTLMIPGGLLLSGIAFTVKLGISEINTFCFCAGWFISLSGIIKLVRVRGNDQKT